MGYVKEGFEIVKLNAKSMEKVSKDKDATTMAILFFALTGLAMAIGTLNLPGLIVLPIMSLVVSFIGVGILHLLALLFGGKAKFMEYYKAVGIGQVGMWVHVVPLVGPVIGGLISLWYLVVSVKLLKAIHKLSTGKAIVVVLIPVIVAVVLAVILVATMVAVLAPMFGSMGPGLLSELGNY